MILGHLDGVIFLGCFAGYIFYMIRTAMKASKEGKQVEIEGGSDEEIRLISMPLSILLSLEVRLLLPLVEMLLLMRQQELPVILG